MKYPIHERFFSFQGEGVHQGRAAFFIRTFGCPIKCDWCDSAGTWHPKFRPQNINRLSARDLAMEAAEANPEFVVITGGEPCVHDLETLVEEIKLKRLPVHLETSGAFPTSARFDWITVSPKEKAGLCLETIRKADELKIIMDSPEAHEVWLDRLKSAGLTEWPKSIWLHPEWSKRNEPKTLWAISEAVKSAKAPRLRAGWQVHKMYKADALDVRSLAPTPLGGQIEKGF